jgi:radical SAM superfamily enzyme YgiQ (UPF0313 family)
MSSMIQMMAPAEVHVSEEKTQAFLDRLFPGRNIRKVLLVNPPDADASLFRYDTAKRHRYTNYPPYGLAVLAAHLRQMGVEVAIVNLNHEVLKRCVDSTSEAAFDFDAVWQSALSEAVAAIGPDLIGVTCMFTMTHVSLRRVCEYLSQFHIPIAIGGVHVSNDVEKVLDDVSAAQIAFLREGDEAIKTFVRVVNREIEASALTQVVFNDAGVRYRFMAEAIPSAESISVLPAFDLIDVADHSRYGTIGAFYCFKSPDTRFATVLSNRGCRAKCTFCSVRNFNGPGVRQRSISSVVDELELLKHEYGVGHIMWLDDDLLNIHRRAIEQFNEMVRRNLDLTWDATNGVIAASCTEDVIAAAAESGCIALNIGMESGNPKILREVVKPGKVETFLRAADVLRQYEQIHASVFLMIGFPGETLSMMMDTINVAREMDLDWYRISPLQPLPNTPIYDSMVAQGLLKDVDRSETRFMGGAYGKQTEIEQGQRMTTADFGEAFNSIAMDAIPTPEQLTDIWFYMNYHLNFHRLFTESRPVKIDQQLKHLRVLSDVISPENGFALYFYGYLKYRVTGQIQHDIAHRLQTARTP